MRLIRAEAEVRASAAEMILAMVQLSQRVADMEAALRDFANNFDCDTDAHRYRTTCRACRAAEVLR